jgi:O-antigen/teichoic acid export membrane protein
VASYTIAQKLFLQPQLIIILLLAAQFPALGEAAARGDFYWVQRAAQKTVRLATGAIVLTCAGLWLIAPFIIAIWLGQRAPVISSTLLGAMFLFGATSALATVFIYLLYALQNYKQVLVGFALMVPLNLALFQLLVRLMGSPGAAVALSIGYLFGIIIPGLVSLSRLQDTLPGLQRRSLRRGGFDDI